MRTKEQKRNKGITLIALIITIIIILILAGITISAITGDNGIIGNAGKAKEESEIANEKEIVEKAVLQAMGNNKYGNIEENELQAQLDKETGEGKTDATDIENEFEVLFIDTNRYYTVDKDGNVGEVQEYIEDKYPGDITVGKDGETLDGQTEKTAYQIWCIEDLVEWTQNYSKYASSCIKLCTTLNFKSKLSYADSERRDYGDLNGNDNDGNTLMNEMTTGTGFRPILYFYGTLDGKFNNEYHEIKNIYINKEGTAGFIIAGNSSTVIKNLSISGEICSTNRAAGIISGDNVSRGMTIINCKNYANIKGKIMVGGICAWANNNVSVQDCENYGKIYIESVDYQYGGAGGIIAYGSGTIQDCYNAGEIYGNYICGGIVGTGESIEIKNCSNTGRIHSIGNYTSGGILGKHRGETINIINCVNEAIIGEESIGYAGGIVGEYIGVSYTTDRILNIYNCYNTGNIVSQNYCGGILGVQGLVSLSINLNIENCYSVGQIQGKYNGGIIGKLTGSDSRTTVTSSIKNTYYLTSSANKAIYEGNCTEEEQIESYDISYMKSESFCNMLNNNIGENTGWKNWILEEDSYPSFG